MKRYFRRARHDAERRQELESYLHIAAEEYIAGGMAPEDARQAARRKLGNPTLIREEIYHMNTIAFFDTLARDLLYTLRGARRNPMFTSVAVLTLALGIGATTAIFAVVNGVLLKPLPYPRPESLVAIKHTARFQDIVSNNVNLSSTMYLTYLRHSRVFQEFGVWGDRAPATVTGLGEPEQVRALTVTHGVLPALAVPPALGRWFSQGDDSPGTPETVILGHGYWQRRLGGDPGVLGRSIVINSRPVTVIGVMAQDFRFLDTSPDVILPRRFSEEDYRPNDVHAYNGIARLKPSATLAQANADVVRMLPQWIEEYGTNRKLLEAAGFAPALRELKAEVVGDVGKVLWVLMGGMGMVLLIACANVANLGLVRVESRRQDLAVRAALGAGWSRVARELLVESVALGILGGVAGLALAYGGIRILGAVAPSNLPRLHDIAVDPLVVAFAFTISMLAGLVFGLGPVARYAGPRMAEDLRTARTTSSSGRARSALVVVQTALALVLLICAGLMIRTFQSLRAVQPGFAAPEQVQAVRLSIPQGQIPEMERTVRMQHDILNAVAAIPGVSAAAFASSLPMETEFENNIGITAEGKAYAEGIPPMRRLKYASPGLFAALGTPLIAGRDFTWADVYDTRSVVIVSENMARETWGEPAAALGKRIRVGRAGAWNEVVGVAANVYDSGVDQAPPATVYFRFGVLKFGPFRFVPRDSTFAVRGASTGTNALLAQIRAAVWSVNPSLPLAQVRTLGEVYDRSLARTSFTLVMLAIAAAMALTLGLIGIYGVIAYSVSQRNREIGIRLALGAQQGELKRMFVRDGVVLAGIGVALGLGAAAGLTRLMSSLLFGVEALDPATFGAVAVVLLMAAIIASYVPARRAAAVDPVEALRAE